MNALSPDAAHPLLRKARPEDVPAIHALLTLYAEKRLLLPRTKEDLLERIGNFSVAELDGRVVACAALRDYGGGLKEVRSLAVAPECARRKIGSALVLGMLRELRERGEHARVFALTYRSDFFLSLGFRIVDKKLFPEKIWSDCIICPKRYCCDETAVLLEL